MKKALIFGFTGQDGYYLAQLLIAKGYKVVGVKRPTSHVNSVHFQELVELEISGSECFTTVYGDVLDGTSVHRLLLEEEPDEIYNLAAQSNVGVSFQIPEYSAKVSGFGPLMILQALCRLGADTKYYQASTSELFGNASADEGLNENSPFKPTSPYAIGKQMGYDFTVMYRQAYSIFAANGILFNHESPKRGFNFVTKKIVNGAVNIALKGAPALKLGNLDTYRDWGYAGEYVEAMWKILNVASEPDDFVIATGESRSVRWFVEETFSRLGISVIWEGGGPDERGYCAKTKRLLIEVSREYIRPADVYHLKGDPSKARKFLDWNPKVTAEMLVDLMVEYELSIS